jgi:hypothetical protein
MAKAQPPSKQKAENLLQRLLDFYTTTQNVVGWINYFAILILALSILYPNYSYKGYGVNIYADGIVAVILIINNLIKRYMYVAALKMHIEMIFHPEDTDD